MHLLATLDSQRQQLAHWRQVLVEVHSLQPVLCLCCVQAGQLSSLLWTGLNEMI